MYVGQFSDHKMLSSTFQFSEYKFNNCPLVPTIEIRNVSNGNLILFKNTIGMKPILTKYIFL